MNPDGYLYSQVWITNIYKVELFRDPWLLPSVTLFTDDRPNVAKDSKAEQRERVRGDGSKPELGFPLERHQRIKHRPLRLELHGLSPIL